VLVGGAVVIVQMHGNNTVFERRNTRNTGSRFAYVGMP